MHLGRRTTRAAGDNRRGPRLAAVGSRLAVALVGGMVLVALARPSSVGAASGATVDTATSTNFGTVLVDAQGFALYTFSSDHGGISSCTTGCATIWPALTVPPGTTPTAGPGVTGTVAATLQPNGTDQVTYNGSPLYTFVSATTPTSPPSTGAPAPTGSTAPPAPPASTASPSAPTGPAAGAPAPAASTPGPAPSTAGTGGAGGAPATASGPALAPTSSAGSGASPGALAFTGPSPVLWGMAIAGGILIVGSLVVLAIVGEGDRTRAHRWYTRRPAIHVSDTTGG